MIKNETGKRYVVEEGTLRVKMANQDIKSAAYMDAIIHYTETLLGIRFKSVKKDRYCALCPFHADTKDSLTVYVNKDDEVRFHCFGLCKGESANILKGFDIVHFIVAYDWNAAGRNSIERMAFKSGGWVYYLGGLSEGQDPYEMLELVANYGYFAHIKPVDNPYL